MQNLSEKQVQLCEAPLPRDVVKKLPGGNGADYVTGHYVISRCNEVFGYDGWSFIPGIMSIMPGPRPVVHVPGTLTVKGITRGDVGVAVATTDKPDALETAIKAAFTDALKRCARTFGASFGLALYDKARADIGMSKAAEDMLVDLDDVVDPTTWWRGHAEAIEKLVADEKAIITAAFVTRRRELDRLAAERQAAAASTPANSETTGPRPVAPTVAAAPPAEPAALVAYRARVSAAASVDALVAVCLELAPSVSAARDPAWAVARGRAVDLGVTEEEFRTALTAAAGITKEPSTWAVVAAVVQGLDTATTVDAVNAVVRQHGAAVGKLPEALRAVLDKRRKVRRAQLGAALPAPVATLEKKLRAATTIPELEALADEIAAAHTSGQINVAEVEVLAKLQDELVSALEREVAA